MRYSSLDTNRFYRRLGQGLSGILAALVLCGTPTPTALVLDSASAKLARQITFRNERITAAITITSLQEVIAAIGQVSGVQIRWLDAGGEESVSVHFVALPLSEAISRLLSGRNFLLFYSSTGEGARLSQVWISSPKTGGERLAPTLPPLL
jgi:hypothetical protein